MAGAMNIAYPTSYSFLANVSETFSLRFRRPRTSNHRSLSTSTRRTSPVISIPSSVSTDDLVWHSISNSRRGRRSDRQLLTFKTSTLFLSPSGTLTFQRRGFRVRTFTEPATEKSSGFMKKLVKYVEEKENQVRLHAFEVEQQSKKSNSLEKPVQVIDKNRRSLSAPTAAAKSMKMNDLDRQSIALLREFLSGFRAGGSESSASKKERKKNIITWIINGIVIFFILTEVGLIPRFGFRVEYQKEGHSDDGTQTTMFSDVQGIDEEKQEVRDLVDYLNDPESFSALGGRSPKGVLFIGPPGTGKTLLARAIAGEAGVPFFYRSGSEFDEMYVGEGARRVRTLFEQARSEAPCIVFIDEIDSVASKRGSSKHVGVTRHANDTINQLLAAMDGFEPNHGVIVIGATNRRDALDPAVTRPGRFDVEINFNLPDLNGRKQIIELYLSKVTASPDVDVKSLSHQTIGMSGADLESLINQAALAAAGEEASAVETKHLEYARDRILMGPERKSSMPRNEETNRNTAYHEAGHALVAYFTQGAEPIHKITIIPRGQSRGHTQFLPPAERYQTTRRQWLAAIDVCMGGRAAEEIIAGRNDGLVTAGAASDLMKATELAKQYVREFGFSARVGLRSYHEELTNDQWVGIGAEMSPRMAEIIDTEIQQILSESLARAKSILRDHAESHHRLAKALLDHETLDADEAVAAIKG